MSQIAERYNHLCSSYLQLADKFQKLDVEHMSLKSKVVPLIKALKAYKDTVETLQQENANLAEELQIITAHYEQLKPLEALLQPDLQEKLAEVEEQMALVDETMREMEEDSTPDLSEEDKLLLEEYQGLTMLELPQAIAAVPESLLKSA